MTPQEQQMLQGLTQRISGTQLAEKDMDAEKYLSDTLGRNPDAMYIMAQTILVQGYAIEQAQKQIADLKAQMEQMKQAPPPEPKHATSFLGSLLGHDDTPQRVAPPPPPPPPAQYGQQGYQQVPVQPQYAPAPQFGGGFAPPQGGGFAMPGQGGGFLRSAMTTAAGVAAGAVAFEGIESLMHGFGHSAGYGSGFGMGMGGGGGFGMGGGERTEVINNNYYGDSAPGHEHGQGLSSDIDDRRGESRFSDAVNSGDHGYGNDARASAADSFANTSSDASDAPAYDSIQDDAIQDDSVQDDSAQDDSAQDDSSSFDDSSDSSSDFDSGGDSGDSGGGDGGF